MKVIDNIAELRMTLFEERRKNIKVGLVPTMGALHGGHLNLIEQSTKQNELTVCSIFVNPAQFNNPEDLNNYPRRLQEDIDLLSNTGCDIVFIPDVEEVYPSMDVLKISFGKLENVLEGEFRPDHFSGVGIVVSKLFNIVTPNTAYFGQKDLQQVAIIKKLVRDLNFDTTVVVVPTVRELSGLAMSSRNLRLSDEGKECALNLYEGLRKVKSSVLGGMEVKQALVNARKALEDIGDFDLEYLEVVNSLTMESVTGLSVANEVSVCGAAYVEKVRIIDNIYIT